MGRNKKRAHAFNNKLTRESYRNNNCADENVFLEETEKCEHLDSSRNIAARFPVKLMMWDFGQCDSKKCTGRKLLRLGFVKQIQLHQKCRGIVLSPNGQISISPADRELISTNGIAVVDCSWAKLTDVPFEKIHGGHHRLCRLVFKKTFLQKRTILTLNYQCRF